MKRFALRLLPALRNHRLVFLLLLAIAAVLLIVSWIYRADSPLSSILIELGAGLALFAMLFFVEHRVLTNRIEASEARHAESMNAVSRRVENIEDSAEALRVSLDELRTQTQDNLNADRRAFISRLDSLLSNIAFDDIFYVLRRARERNEISIRGIRIDLEDDWKRLRFDIDKNPALNGALDSQDSVDPELVSLTIESLSGEVFARVDWCSSDAPDRAFASVAFELQRLGMYFGDRQFDPSLIMRKLVYSLRFAHACRSHGNVGSEIVGPVIEIIWPVDHLKILDRPGVVIERYQPGVVRPQWLISDHGVESMHYTYVIDESRVHEPDWISHMDSKAWVDIMQFQSAIVSARALFPKSDCE
ncbi:MAG: hypothetical protein OXG43_02130 [Chloroflexi bacterium]|nr:hypothetical protein [Chloroflexota bacterium]